MQSRLRTLMFWMMAESASNFAVKYFSGQIRIRIGAYCKARHCLRWRVLRRGIFHFPVAF